MWPRRAQEIQIKTPEQFAVLREAGLVVAKTLAAVAAAGRPGATTAELAALAWREIRAGGASRQFVGYHGYPATICTSVNDEIVHGIPSAARSLTEGDLISVDCGAIVRGWHGDAAVTVGVGAISAEHAALLGACEDALWQGLAQARAGARLGELSPAAGARSRGPVPAGATSRTRWSPVPPRRVRTAWSRSTPGTASAPPCTWTRRCRTTAGPLAGRGCGRAWRWPSSRWGC